jgi:hypothetical protein
MADDDDHAFSASGSDQAATAAGLTLAAIITGAFARARDIIALADSYGVARVPVSSTCISQLAYHVISGDLEVHFHDGSIYFYPQESMTDFLAFVNARSKGSHYNRYWRNKRTFIQSKKKGSHMLLGSNR